MTRITFPASPLVAAALAIAGSAATVAAQPLNRNLSQYCIFAQQSVSLKNIHVDNACNVGVNCAQPSTHSSCGTATFEDTMFAKDTQMASDKIALQRAGAVFWQLFTNKPFNGANATINSPPIQTFTTPIIPNTCDANCNADPSAIEAFCNFPHPFPACDPSKLVSVNPGADCSAFDSSPGNGVCDLPPGTYGDIVVKNGATINFSAGTYDVCSLSLGQSANATGSATVINIPDSGFFRVGNDSRFGQQHCGDFTVRIQGAGSVNFGRRVVLQAQVCAPRSTVNLGHGNVLLGQFIGLTVDANRDDSVKLCTACTCP